MDLFGLGEIVSGTMDLTGRIWEREKEEDFLHEQRMGNEALTREMAERNYQQQKEFAQHGVRWRVEDAMAAGVHPVWSLSGGGAAFSPSAMIGSSGSPGNFGIGDALGRMGQSVKRAVAGPLSAHEREMQRLLELKAIEEVKQSVYSTELLRRQVDGTGIPGQGGTNRFSAGQVGPALPAPKGRTEDGVIVNAYAAGSPIHYEMLPDVAYDTQHIKPAPGVAIRDSERDVAAGGGPAWMKRSFGGVELAIPFDSSGNVSEAFEGMHPGNPLFYMFLHKNWDAIREHGIDYVAQLFDQAIRAARMHMGTHSRDRIRFNMIPRER